MDPRTQVSRRNPDGTRRRQGRYIGPMRVTPTRIMLAIAVVGSLGYIVYGVTVRESTQIPVLASGAAVLGIVFAALAVAGLVETIRAARADEPGRSMVLALLAGVAAIISLVCFGGAAVLAIMYRSTP